MTFEFVTTYDLEYVRYWGEQHTMAVTLAFMEIAQLLLSVFYEVLLCDYIKYFIAKS